MKTFFSANNGYFVKITNIFSKKNFFFQLSFATNEQRRLCKGSFKSSHRRCSVRKGVLGNFAKFTGKHMCQNLYFNKVAGLRQALAQVFSCEFCEISKNTFLTEHVWATTSFIFSKVAGLHFRTFKVCLESTYFENTFLYKYH